MDTRVTTYLTEAAPMNSPYPLLAVMLTLCSFGANAEEHKLGQHPAVLVQAQAPRIDPNRFIVAPPASVTWVRSHANAEHPAVLVARQAPSASIDVNTFLVQPPVTVTWTPGPSAEPALKLAQSSSQR